MATRSAADCRSPSAPTSAVVHPDTQMSVREVHWGLVPDMTGTLMLSSLVRADVAKELVFTARIFDGREALCPGVGDQAVGQPARRCILHGRARSPVAVPTPFAPPRPCSTGCSIDGAAEQFAAEREVIGSVIGKPNQIEAVMANFEKRASAFTDPA